MKKIITHFLPVLAIILSGTSFLFAQNENTSTVNCETAVDFSTPANAPAGVSKNEPSVMSLLYDNGGLVNFAGQGTGGADVSAMHDGLKTYGFGMSTATNTRICDDFVVPAAQKWTIDSIVFFSYQTGSTLASTYSDLHLAVRNASPLTNASPSAIIWGDTTTNVLDDSHWSGIYRATSATLTATARPIMKLRATTAALALTAGTYWLDWQATGSLTSGPWGPPITTTTATTTGDGMQMNAGPWVAVNDSANGAAAPQGFPFIIYGTISNGVNEIYNNNNVTLYPNPMTSSTNVTVSDNIRKSTSGFTFVVYDVIGNTVKKVENISSNNFTIKKENMPAGVYIYEVQNGNEIIKRGKLSVQND